MGCYNFTQFIFSAFVSLTYAIVEGVEQGGRVKGMETLPNSRYISIK